MTSASDQRNLQEVREMGVNGASSATPSDALARRWLRRSDIPAEASAFFDQSAESWMAAFRRVLANSIRLSSATPPGSDDAASEDGDAFKGADEAGDGCDGWRELEAATPVDLDEAASEPAVREPPSTAGEGVEDEKLSRFRAALEATIQAEIIPRLMLTHQVGIGADRLFEAPGARDHEKTFSQEVVAFSDLLQREGATAALEWIQELRGRGWSLDEVYLDLLAPCARRYGVFWVHDAMSFADVTIGLSRLHFILRALSDPADATVSAFDTDRRVLFAPLPGEQHTFGVCMVADFFRRAGWDVTEAAPQSVEELVHMIESGGHALVGLSIAHSARLDPLAAALRDMRRLGGKGPVGAMVGGRLFADKPELALRIGADATATDALNAIVQAERLLGSMERRR